MNRRPHFKHNVLTALFVLLCFVGNASILRIALGEADQHPSLQSRTYLFGHFVNMKTQIDSLFAGNLIEISLSDSLPHGLYNVMIYSDLKDVDGKYQRIGFDLIVNGKDIDITIEITETRNYGRVAAKSGDNATYFSNFNESRLREKRTEALKEALAEYPGGDDFHTQLQEQLSKLQGEHGHSHTSETETEDPIAHYFLNVQEVLEKGDPNAFDFTSSLLKNSSFIPIISWKYLDEGEKDDGSSVSLSQRLIRRLAVLLPKLKEDDAVKELMVGEIVRYYEKKGWNEVVLYINEVHVLPDVCENTELTNQLEKKNRRLKSLLVGQPAPDLQLNTTGEMGSLSEVKAENTLLIFWESICPHCQDVTDELAVYYDKNRAAEFEILAVALDTSRTEYLTYLKEHDFKWLNEVDYTGWNGQAAQTYNVRATPSMFLLDREKTIIARPSSVAELKAFLPDY